MHILILILLLVAAVCFGLATFGVATRINLVAAGLFSWVLTVLIPVLTKTT